MANQAKSTSLKNDNKRHGRDFLKENLGLTNSRRESLNESLIKTQNSRLKEYLKDQQQSI